MKTKIGQQPIILSIAGFDPSSGAGITSDVKAAENIGVYALGVNTANTIQHESKFTDVNWSTEEQISSQINILKEKYEISYIKIGLIQHIGLIKTVAKEFPEAKIIWDPILSASAGFSFHRISQKNEIKKMATLCYLITPNLGEWQKIGSLIEGKTNVLVKGGHAIGHANDELILKSGEKHLIEGKRLDVSEKHGSGCVLSTAITSYLAQGNELSKACELGKNYVIQFLQSNDGLLGLHLSRTK
ncbi:MAG: hydroxymethylpyrimidine/phosphomethylpyrimidine kinase [Cyclobacteriaceae bacterium]